MQLHFSIQIHISMHFAFIYSSFHNSLHIVLKQLQSFYITNKSNMCKSNIHTAYISKPI